MVELRLGAEVTLHDPLYLPDEIRHHGFAPGALSDSPAPEAVVLNTAHAGYANLDFVALAARGVKAVLDGQKIGNFTIKYFDLDDSSAATPDTLRSRLLDLPGSTWVPLAGAAAVVAWVLSIAARTISYLWPQLWSGVRDLARVITLELAGRNLFVSNAGRSAPLFERGVGIASVLVVLALLAVAVVGVALQAVGCFRHVAGDRRVVGVGFRRINRRSRHHELG